MPDNPPHGGAGGSGVVGRLEQVAVIVIVQYKQVRYANLGETDATQRPTAEGSNGAGSWGGGLDGGGKAATAIVGTEGNPGPGHIAVLEEHILIPVPIGIEENASSAKLKGRKGTRI